MYTFEIWTGDCWTLFENKNCLPTVGMIVEFSQHNFRNREVTRVILDVDKDIYTIETEYD